MKSKILPLLAGAIALSLSAIPVLSQSTTPTPSPQRNQTQMRRSNFLNLTPEQQTRMEQIRQNERSQIDTILTAEQKAQLQQERQNRKSRTGQNRGTPPTGQTPGTRPAPFASLNLTAEQRSRIDAVMQSSRQQMDAILTPQQRQQLEQHKQQHEQRRQANSQTSLKR